MKQLFIIFFFSYSFIFAVSPAPTPAWQNLMPQPQKIEIKSGKFIIDKHIQVAIPTHENKRIEIAATKFIRRLTNRTGLFVTHGFPLTLQNTEQPGIVVQYKRKGRLDLYEDESYEISINSKQVRIQAETDLGVIYAFETLLQLLDNDGNTYFFQNVLIQDKPAFTWRGLMIDASRHFQPVAVIKRNLDAMLVAKMNTFHWHLSDDHGFRVQIKKYPQLTASSASDGQFYTQEQIKEIVQYADDRGIRVIPEIDVPGHATAILVAFPQIGSKKMDYHLQRNAGIFDPTLDPTNPQTYVVLDQIFKELSRLFPFPYFHIGGDENKGLHWDENSKIQAFKQKHGFKTNHELQTYFNIKLSKILKKYQKNLMGWQEIMTPGMPKDAIIHAWAGKEGESLAQAAKNGFKAVLSNGFYIDLMLPASEHYKTSLNPEAYQLTDDEKQRILGGETTMWSELVTPLTIDSRIWPRSLAIGERLWSNPEKTDIDNMYKRMFAQSYHLEELGIMHLRNQDVILRNITDNQDITPLKILTGVYEPLKYYTRNKGGAEYQTYSPFMCFADACTADAKDALDFSAIVYRYLQTESSKAKRKIIDYLKLWTKNHRQLISLKSNPKLSKLYPMSESLADLSMSMLVLSNKFSSVDQDFADRLKVKFENAFKDYNDVRLAQKEAFDQLIAFWLKQRKLHWE